MDMPGTGSLVFELVEGESGFRNFYDPFYGITAAAPAG
jgi:hypothetical protein